MPRLGHFLASQPFWAAMFEDDCTCPTGTAVKSMLPAWKASHSVEGSVNSGMWMVSTNGPLVALAFHQLGFLTRSTSWLWTHFCSM